MAAQFTPWQKFYKTFIPKLRTSVTIRSHRIEPDSGVETSDEKDSEKYKDLYDVEDAYEDYISWLDRFIAVSVDWSGSISCFFVLVAILIIWIVFGIVAKGGQDWQIIMQDGQSIQCYFWDTLLMRQQLDDTHDFLKLYGRIKSRGVSCKRILTEIAANPPEKEVALAYSKNVDEESQETINEVDLIPESLFQKLCDIICRVLGSLPAIVIYWIGVFLWIGCGRIDGLTGNTPPYTADNPEYGRWSNNWQMYINTAVAVELLITSVMLENVRSQSNGFIKDQIEVLEMLDCKIEALGRHLTGDEIENELVTVQPVERKKFRKYISIYAEVIGTGLGLVLSLIVFAAWLAVGRPMQWSSNWWLIIGTYTGLIGFFDGFILREVFQSVTVYENSKFLELIADSQELLDIAGIKCQLHEPEMKKTIGLRISTWVNDKVSSQWSVVASMVFVLILILIASGMKWNETGQLICNTPTMIIEGFCLLVLIQAHGWADYDRRGIVRELAVSRKYLKEYLELKVTDEKNVLQGANVQELDKQDEKKVEGTLEEEVEITQ